VARLVVKFESQVLREIPIGAHPLTIGRSPDNLVHIDNLAVSDHHARLYTEGDKMVIEDLGSLNGTYVNDLRVTRATLRDGDNIQIGKHLLQLDTVHEASTTVADGVSGARKTPKSKIAGAAAFDAKEQRELLRQSAIAAAGADALPAPSIDLLHAPTMRVLRGRTDQREYILVGKLTVIGSSEMASVRLLGWFAPVVGAQINHHENGYYLGLGDIVPKVNGQPIQGPTRLQDGDVIQVGRVRLQFSSPD
jgi:pSer/pThr/pTyr-binding forkhead associated (FHA) protein